MHRRRLGQHPCSPCSIHMPPLGTLRRCRFWLSNVGMPGFLTRVQGVPKLLVHGPHLDYQGCSQKSTIPVLVMINRADYCPQAFSLQAQSKAQEAWRAPWECQQEPLWRVFPGEKFLSEGLLGPPALGSVPPGTCPPPQGSGDLGTLNRGYKAIIVLRQNILIMTSAIL